MKNWKRTVALAAAILSAASVTAYAQAPKKGGILNFAVIAEPPDYDCHGSTTFALIHPIAPHYQTLLKFDGKEYPKIVGDVAQSWTVSADGLTYTFKINPGIRFHNGTDLTSADVKASYDRIVNPPTGVVSARKAYYSAIKTIETPDPMTVVFKLSAPNASMLQSFASPYDCIYSAAKLKENPKYPQTEIMGSGPFQFVEHVKGSHWSGKRFDGYYRKGLPYLDGYKAYFVKGTTVVTGMLGGQFDVEFRGFNPQQREQLLSKDKDKWVVHEGTWVNNLMIIFNTKKKPFDDVKVRQALTLAIDRWAGAQSLSKVSIMRYVGGIMRPGYQMALPEAELVKLPGFGKDIEASRTKAKALLKEAGLENVKFKLLNRNVPEPYTPAGIYVVDQWRRIGVAAEHEQLETKLYLDAVAAGNFDVAIEFMADFMDDPTAQFAKYLTKKASPIGYSGHEDYKLDEMYEKQRAAINVADRTKIVHDMERYALEKAYNVPILWWQRIIIHHKKIKGWYMTPSHYLWQDLSEVWLDQ